MMSDQLWLRIWLALSLLTVNYSVVAEYQEIVFETGSGINQSVLVDDLGLVVFSATDEVKRHYQRFELPDGAKTPKRLNRTQTERTPVADSVIFVDEVVTPTGTATALIHRDRATLLENGATLLEYSSIYNAPAFMAIPHFDAFRDLNGDGLDDFVIQTFDGYAVAVQRGDGTFSETIAVAAKPLMDMSYNNHPWYQAKNLFVTDMTGDARADLSVWQPESFHVYAQNMDGSFSEALLEIPHQLPVEYDSVDGMSVRFANEDQSDKTVSVIHSLADYNADGITDLMAMDVKSEGVFRKTTTFSLYKGELIEQEDQSSAVRFDPTVFTRVNSKGIQYRMTPADVDGDGDLDLMISSVELGVGKIIGALLTSSIKIDLGFYPLAAEGYSAKAATTRNIAATFSLSSGEFWLPAVQLVDQNADGRLDLFLQESDDELLTYLGDDSQKVFAERGQSLEVSLPKDPDLIRQLDVNADGIEDLLMRVPPPLGEETGHRTVLLLSQPAES